MPKRAPLVTTLSSRNLSDMCDMAVGQPDLFDGDIGLLDRGPDFRNVPAGIDHGSLFGGFAPYQGAILLKQRHRNDDGAGFGPGFGLLCHASTMPIFRR